MIEFAVDEKTAITGQALKNISFPKETLISAMIRNGDLVTPHGDTTIQPGDILYILTAKKEKGIETAFEQRIYLKKADTAVHLPI